MTVAPLAGRTLLAVVAHPDDESLACGALLARVAALGARVVVATLTRGEAGPADEAGSSEGRSQLAARRTAEFRTAAATLGAEAVLFDHPDGMLPWVPHDEIVGDLHRLLEGYQPDVVVTFGADGLYWHPDHVAVHERVTEVVVACGAAAPALYYVTMPPGQMRAVVAHAGGSLPVVPGVVDADAFGAEAEFPTLLVATGGFAAVKLAAIRSHHSQFAASAFARLTPDDAERLLPMEYLHRAAVGAPGVTFLDALGTAPLPGPVGPPH